MKMKVLLCLLSLLALLAS